MPRGPYTQTVILLTRSEVREALLLDVLSACGDVVRLSEGVAVDVETDAGVHVRVSPEHRPFPDAFDLASDDGATWMLGGFGPTTLPGCLERARAVSPEAHALGEHLGTLRLNTHHGLAPDDPILPAGHTRASDALVLAPVATALLRGLPCAHAWFVPGAELLLGREQVPSLDLPDLFVRVRAERHGAGHRVDTLGMDALDLPDVELMARETDLDALMRFARASAWGQATRGALRPEGSTYGPNGRWYVDEEPRWREPARPTVRLVR